ncbi:hypothetical protein SDC9_142910 [bioreactor metagenome]|uniref:Uncharacterized protein n=1 Tax=bioreactor metagenome TaxID=1076179 RepID=A0A645E2K0_9ZZZZ|nr:hypothetical protein [Erysipelotrichaceae bacterium]
MMMNAYLPEKLNAFDQLESTHVWDSRDGLPELFFKYTYIIVADPIQYNNNANQQQVFGILADGMLNDPDLQQYYQVIKTYDYSDGIEIYIYQLVSDVSEEVISKYEKLIYSCYPEWEGNYKFAR